MDTGEKISEGKLSHLALIIEDENEIDWESRLPKKGDKKLGVNLSGQPPKYSEELVEYVWKKICRLCGRKKIHKTRSRQEAWQSTGELSGDIDLLVATIQWTQDFARVLYKNSECSGTYKRDMLTVKAEGILSIIRRKFGEA